MSTRTSPHLRILVIDDDEVDRLRIARFLGQVPGGVFRIESTTTVAGGVAAIRENSFDCVLLDYRLPDGTAMDVLEAVEASRGLCPPIVVQTVNGSDEAALVAVAHGAQDYLVKGGFDSPLLYRSIRYAIERDRLNKERNTLLAQLQEAFEHIRRLEGILPICSHCKKIRDEAGEWTQLERYIMMHSGAQFSHGVCPQCAQQFYSDYLKR